MSLYLKNQANKQNNNNNEPPVWWPTLEDNRTVWVSFSRGISRTVPCQPHHIAARPWGLTQGALARSKICGGRQERCPSQKDLPGNVRALAFICQNNTCVQINRESLGEFNEAAKAGPGRAVPALQRRLLRLAASAIWRRVALPAPRPRCRPRASGGGGSSSGLGLAEPHGCTA